MKAQVGGHAIVLLRPAPQSAELIGAPRAGHGRWPLGIFTDEKTSFGGSNASSFDVCACRHPNCRERRSSPGDQSRLNRVFSEVSSPHHTPPTRMNPEASRLAQRGAEKLAEFILTLADDENGIGEYVRAYIAADDPPAAVEELKTEIALINAREREYDYRHRRGNLVVQRVAHVLDAIELVILPASTRAAFDLLVEVIESDEQIVNQSGDADLQPTFERVCDMLLAAARSLYPLETKPILERLALADDYGLRQRLKQV